MKATTVNLTSTTVDRQFFGTMQMHVIFCEPS